MKHYLTILVLSASFAFAQTGTVGPSGQGITTGTRSAFLDALGGTTAGKALFQVPNPGAITFPRINANNTASLLSAGDTRTALGLGSLATVSSLTGVVTSTGAATAIADSALSIAKTTGLQTALDGKVGIREVPVFTKASWSRYANSSSGILSMTSRRRVIAICDASALKLVFQNSYAENNGYSNITVKACVEDDSGGFYPVTFSGSRTVTVPNTGELVTSDAVAGLTTGKGRIYWLRVNSSWASGNCYLNGVVDNSTQPGEGRIDSVDYTDSGTITTTTNYAYTANMVLGTPTRHNPFETVVFIGDSNMDLIDGGFETWEDSWTVSSLGRQHGRNHPYIRLSLSGSRIDTVLNVASTRRRRFIPYGSIVIVLLGTNDTRASVSAATTMANLQTFYRELLASGAKEVWGCTLPPDTSVTNQNAIRVALNDLIRAEPNPLRGVIDIADALETSRNSNVWITGYNAADNYHPNPTGAAVLRTLLRNQLFSDR